jgi:hypothetical protein
VLASIKISLWCIFISSKNQDVSQKQEESLFSCYCYICNKRFVLLKIKVMSNEVRKIVNAARIFVVRLAQIQLNASSEIL